MASTTVSSAGSTEGDLPSSFTQLLSPFAPWRAEVSRASIYWHVGLSVRWHVRWQLTWFRGSQKTRESEHDKSGVIFETEPRKRHPFAFAIVSLLDVNSRSKPTLREGG